MLIWNYVNFQEEEKKKNKDSKEKQLEMINETNNNDQTLNDSLKQNSPEECDVKINNKEKGNYEAACVQMFCSY